MGRTPVQNKILLKKSSSNPIKNTIFGLFTRILLTKDLHIYVFRENLFVCGIKPLGSSCNGPSLKRRYIISCLHWIFLSFQMTWRHNLSLSYVWQDPFYISSCIFWWMGVPRSLLETTFCIKIHVFGKASSTQWVPTCLRVPKILFAWNLITWNSPKIAIWWISFILREFLYMSNALLIFPFWYFLGTLLTYQFSWPISPKVPLKTFCSPNLGTPKTNIKVLVLCLLLIKIFRDNLEAGVERKN